MREIDDSVSLGKRTDYVRLDKDRDRMEQLVCVTV